MPGVRDDPGTESLEKLRGHETDLAAADNADSLAVNFRSGKARGSPLCPDRLIPGREKAKEADCHADYLLRDADI